jgi:Zn-dependent M16 (insulinase) family peptidase
MGVYLDATFFPLLRPLDFMQEGHRLEFEDPTGTILTPKTAELCLDASSELKFKGIVFNEMKGALVLVAFVSLHEHVTAGESWHLL